MGRLKAALTNLLLLGLVAATLVIAAAVGSGATSVAVFYGCAVAFLPHAYFTLRVALTTPKYDPGNAMMVLLRAEASKLVFSMVLFALLFRFKPDVQAPAVFLGVAVMLMAQIVASAFLAKQLAAD